MAMANSEANPGKAASANSQALSKESSAEATLNQLAELATEFGAEQIASTLVALPSGVPKDAFMSPASVS